MSDNVNLKIKRELTEEQKQKRKEMQKKYSEIRKEKLKNPNPTEEEQIEIDKIKHQNNQKKKTYYEKNREKLQDRANIKYREKAENSGKKSYRKREIILTNEDKKDKNNEINNIIK
ncbi:hypothetical protein BMW23_1034 [Bodo saltans virus]|uniref:Uncharacterized protein n=1 Tax=Bodo saltans virus TaxID=2024608 RepID=A0A2H4UWI8_9VIRU|nr:hypothetical protein QJ851_gp1016 [Bodo saltans virus]ATZ81079.1 hypothetical protein BMW23_1034 [Bodo saltans virus]